MKKIIIFLSVIVLSACSNGNNNAIGQENKPPVTNQVETKTEYSFPYPLLVWNNQKYKITDEAVEDVDKEIGEIVNYSTDEPMETLDNYSNYYKSGTKIWSIKGVGTEEAIAAETQPGKYVRAEIEKLTN